MASFELKVTIISRKNITPKTPDNPEIKTVNGNDIHFPTFPGSYSYFSKLNDAYLIDLTEVIPSNAGDQLF